MVRLSWQKFKYNLHYSKYYPGPLIPPTYLRKKILDILDKTDTVSTEFIRRDQYQGGSINKNGAYMDLLRQEFYKNIDNTDYTLCIRGTGNFSARFYETLALGRIPIFINTDCILPFNDVIDWEKHVIWIERYEIPYIDEKIIDFHNGKTRDSFKQLQNENRQLWEEYFNFASFYDKLVAYLNKEIN